MTSVRKDIRSLSQEEMDNLIYAWHLLQKVDPSDPDSFFQIAGYHGEPFRGAGYNNPQWWGGYCNHGNILFPTWHRAYVLRLEKALQKQVPYVAMPYWNEIDHETLSSGVPKIFLQEKYTFADGTEIDNPLLSYTFQKKVQDRISQPFPDADYSKPEGYSTVRYPFSGLVGQADVQATDDYNANMRAKGIDYTNQLLNDNVVDWLTHEYYYPDGGQPVHANVAAKYLRCLDAPNYAVFSNTTSAERWNDDLPKDAELVVPVESPHNSIHLAVGGIHIPVQNDDASDAPDANGDMGENDTASFDPIFFFHHCFIDRMFWAWQVRHSQQQGLVLEPQFAEYPGTNSVDAQGPTPGVPGNTWLSLDSPLAPFVKPNGTPLTSNDVANIEALGYKYDHFPKPRRAFKDATPSPHLKVSGVSRGGIRGSFVVAAWTKDASGNPHKLLGAEPVLSRWHVADCANCQNHLEVGVHIPLQGWTKRQARDHEKKEGFVVMVHTRDKPNGHLVIGKRTPKVKLQRVTE